MWCKLTVKEYLGWHVMTWMDLEDIYYKDMYYKAPLTWSPKTSKFRETKVEKLSGLRIEQMEKYCPYSIGEEQLVLESDSGNSYVGTSNYCTTSLVLPNCALKMVIPHSICIHTWKGIYILYI